MRVDVADLVGNPGRSRRLVQAVGRDDVGDVGLGPAEEAVAGPIELDLRLESLVDGIVVRGEVVVDVELACARCLRPIEDHLELPVTELYHHPDHEAVEEGYEIVDDAIDLEPLLRDTVITAVPVRVLCREDCQGLCVVCGADRNQTDCGHEPAATADPRWAKLAEVQVPPDRN